MKHARLAVALLLLLAVLTLGACHTTSPDTADTTTPAETTPAETSPADGEVKEQKYFYYLFPARIQEDAEGRRFVQAECKVSLNTDVCKEFNSQSPFPARAWLVLPDGSKIASEPITDVEKQVYTNKFEKITTFSFYGLPNGFNVGKYDFLVSEYDDTTGEGDYEKKLFEDVTTEISTGRYEFELEGDLIFKLGYQCKSLIADIYCIVTCVSGRDYYTSSNGFYYTGAELIAPDGTTYKFNPLVSEGTKRADVKPGDVFKEEIYFENLPLDLAPGKYDLLVWNTTNGQSKTLFENVTVRFEDIHTISSREVMENYPPTASLSSADQVQRVGIRMGDAIVEGYEYIVDAVKCEFYNEQTNVATYITPEMTLPYPNYARSAANGEMPIIKYSDDIEIINNLDYVYSYDGDICFVPLFENAANGPVSTPTVPGVYYTEIRSTMWPPYYQDDNGNKAPSGMPKPQVGELYPFTYCHGFIVYVE